ncbi:MAG: hypothetical protein Q7T57_07080 [Dehalococcoidales bacterium]|jgi:hypothetical protein|nr:hypothetical protein [Dehalococcoidales bacterium]
MQKTIIILLSRGFNLLPTTELAYQSEDGMIDESEDAVVSPVTPQHFVTDMGGGHLLKVSGWGHNSCISEHYIHYSTVAQVVN